MYLSRRRVWMLVHRVNGLMLASFLTIVGLTGSIIAWNDRLERLFAPQLFVLPPHPPGPRTMLDPFTIRELAARAHPEAAVNSLELIREPDIPAQIYLEPPLRTEGGAQTELPNDTAFLDPYTGKFLGQRSYGDLTQGWKNLVPFVYQLHQNLALGEFGRVCLGLAALLWTIDCFIGFYLTFPASTSSTRQSISARLRRWPARWLPSWLIRWQQGYFRRTYDLHRATGLWIWAMLLLFAWSGVAFNLPSVYRPVMHVFGERELAQPPARSFCAATSSQPVRWPQALVHAQSLMDEQARQFNFQVRSERFLSYDPESCLFTYRVKSSLDIGKLGNTQITFAQGSPQPLTVWRPTGETPASTFTTWIENLHEAQVFGLWFRILICLTGLLIVTLSITGVLIFLKKLPPVR